MQLLLIKIASLDANPEYALLGKKQAEDRFTPGDWKKVKSLTSGRRVVLLLPDNEVVLSAANVPSKNKKQLTQAVPFALEESLADDIDDLHFSIYSAPVAKKTDKSTEKNQDKNNDLNYVAIINRARLTQFLDKLHEAHIPVHFVLPQLFTLEQHDKSWALQINDNTAQLRLDVFSGFSCEKNMLDLFLPAQLEKQIPDAIYSNLNGDELPASLLEMFDEIPLKTSPDSALVKRNSIMSALPLNLLNGFVRDSRASKINFKPWKPAMALAGILGAIWLGILSWQNVNLSKQNRQLDAAMGKVYKDAFPQGRLVDPPQQMASKLKELQGKSKQTIQSPLPLIAQIGPLLQKQKDMTLREIRYQEDELRLIVRSPNLNQLETFKAEASKVNIDIDIKTSTTTANKVEATLVITSKEGDAA